MTRETQAAAAYDAEDAIKHIASWLDRHVRVLVWARDNLANVAPEARFEDLAISGARDFQRTVREHLAVHGGWHWDRYSTGLPVTSRVELRDDELWEWCWHPDPANEHNQPRALNPAMLPDGRRGAVIVAAPGVLDLVPDGTEGGN